MGNQTTSSIAVQFIPIEKITSSVQIRSLKEYGVKRLEGKIRALGFLSNFPLLVTPATDGYKLIDGNHRLAGAKNCGETTVPCHVLEDIDEIKALKLAIRSNEASETLVPTTFVDQAELIWKLENESKTQTEVGEVLGWSRSKVLNFAQLKQICQQAWAIVTDTINKLNVSSGNEDSVSSNDTTVSFTEGLLRGILQLEESQQLYLVSELASNKITKNKFKSLAEAYRARNEMTDYVEQQLGEIDSDLLSKAITEVESGRYDREWAENNKAAGDKLLKLIVSIRDEYQLKHSIQIVHGDFYQEVLKIGDGSIDLIISDPPYNVANNREFQLEGRSNISQNFGEWDKFAHKDFIALFDSWAKEWARILKPQGSGYVFTSDIYISYLREALHCAGLTVKNAIVWHKTNPGTQVIKTSFKSSVEYILFFTKAENGHTFNWLGENEMHNFIEAPICGGDERLKDNKGNTLHPTQKPEKIIRHLMEISSNRGDMIFDGFAGVGTTGKVAKELGRKFIGIEQDKNFFDAIRRRLA